jgi:hypothetical protein
MATVSILNTSANVSGKTIALAERDHTITGLWTFDRDPSAPFTVTANSAVAPNLDADKVDGAHYVFSSYTPTWGNTGTANTLGNATVSGRYVQLGSVVVFNVVFVFGSTSVSGNGTWTFTLPVTAIAASTVLAVANYVDSSGSANYSGYGLGNSTTTVLCVTTGAPAGGVVSSSPFVWAQNDTVALVGAFFTA